MKFVLATTAACLSAVQQLPAVAFTPPLACRAFGQRNRMFGSFLSCQRKMIGTRGYAIPAVNVVSSSHINTCLEAVTITNRQQRAAWSSSRLSLSTASSSSSDDSAMSKSRAPFSMPRQSPNDSKPLDATDKKNSLAWNELGLWTELVTCLQTELEFPTPTPIQSMTIPVLLADEHKSLCFLAATGSGKTLAYALPLMQWLKQTEVFDESSSSSGGSQGMSNSLAADRPRQRPRLVILAPTRELVLQITATVKQLCHVLKLSACALYKGKENYSQQTTQLNRPVDIVVATPARLLQHVQDKHVYLSRVQHVVVDEMDTLLEQGFATELRALLYPVLYHRSGDQLVAETTTTTTTATELLQPNAPRLVLTSATMTRAILKMIGQQSGNDKDDTVQARKHYVKKQDGSPNNTMMILPPMQLLKAPGLHRVVPRLQQVFVDAGSTDKMSLLIDILSSSSHKDQLLTMVFCNTAASCRAVEYALGEAKIAALPYHGELNSSMRTANLQEFRRAGQILANNVDGSSSSSSSVDKRILVCTDLAARGLDVPQVHHVVMFDFPLNALDYLHRSGRTARGYDLQRKGRVTALVTKRDRVLANAIEQAVQRGEPLDGLSSRKSDYLPGGRLHETTKRSTSRHGSTNRDSKRTTSPRGKKKTTIGASVSSTSSRRRRGGSSSPKTSRSRRSY